MMRHALLSAAALLAGCGGGTVTRGSGDPGATDAGAASIVAPRASTGATNGPPPPPATKAAAPSIEQGSAEGAAAVVRAYYAALAARDYGAAWRMWDHGGEASGLSEAAFASSFAPYATYSARIGTPGRIEPGAGQRYVTVPVEINGTLRSGERAFHARGSVALHRVADIDGASESARRWHLHSVDVTRITGVSAAGVPAVASALYRCMDGSRLHVRFDNRSDTATISRDGVVIGVLAGQRPASGIWYRSDRLGLRGKGRDATFTEPGKPPMACRASS